MSAVIPTILMYLYEYESCSIIGYMPISTDTLLYNLDIRVFLIEENLLSLDDAGNRRIF